jgi:hypothetical protein
VLRAAALLLLILAVPGSARAQPAIAGVVRDVTGAAVAGALVEASSPVLIEQTRSTMTDDRGRYRLADLLPGVYDVRVTATGMAPQQRSGVALAGNGTAVVDVELGVGAIQQTTEVVASAPVLDVFGTRREVSLSGPLLKSLPIARTFTSVLFTVPGVVTTAIDTITGTALTSFPVHGGRNNEGRLEVDGWTVGSPPSGNSPTNYSIDVGNAVEVTLSPAGLGERETGGVLMNVVTRSGGNRTSGSLYAGGTSRGLQSSNVTPALREQGVAATPLSKVYDVSATVGGPLRRDHAWYALTAHSGGSRRSVANVYYNQNAGNAAAWLYAPDTARPEYSDRTFENASVRLTWQVTPRNKISGYWDAQAVCRTCTGATPGAAEPARISPEAVGVLGRQMHVTQVSWSSPFSPHVLLEAGYGGTFFGVGNFERDPNPTRGLVRVVEQCASGCARNGGIPGLAYRSQDFSIAHTGSYQWKASAAYVSGTTSVKAGYQRALMTDDRTWYTNDQNLTYRVNDGVPNQLTQSISPWVNDARAGWDAVYAEVQRTAGRLTAQGALRFDRARSWFPAQQEGPSRFLPDALLIAPARGVDSYKDLTPRLGAAYDVFGDGRTAIKAQIGKYLEGVGVSGTYAGTNPTLRLPQTTPVFGTAGVTRAWLDANGNFVPDCQLLDPAAQDWRAAGGDMCGVMSNTQFGTPVFTSHYDPAVLDGWGVRASDWTFAASLEHRLFRQAVVTLSYTRRSFDGFTVADNLAVSASDFTPFEIIAPLDARLPGGGGYPVTGLYDVVPEKAGQVKNVITRAAQLGRWWQRFNGIDATLDWRARDLRLSAGFSSGQSVTDNCDVRTHLPELATTTTGTSAFGAGLATSAVTPVSPYCHTATGILTYGRGLASYLLPGAGIQLSAVWQSRPGAMLAANYAVPNAAAAASLGRNLSGNAANVTVNLIPPGTRYGDRVQELDLRVGKRLMLGPAQARLSVDVYNALNASAVLAYNPSFVPQGTWLQPIGVQTARFFRLSAEIEF